VIAPPDYLDAFAAQEPARVHHVAAQRVLTDAAYSAFFYREAQRGAEIVVDNGVFDLGHALPATDLIAAARAVEARSGWSRFARCPAVARRPDQGSSSR
jgi:hypothetical protein